MLIYIGLVALGGATAVTLLARGLIVDRTRGAFKVLATPHSRIPTYVERPVDDDEILKHAAPDSGLITAGLSEKMSADDGLELRLFRAGIFAEDSRRRFKRWRWLAPLLGICVTGTICLGIGLEKIWLPVLLGAVIGFQLPRSYLRRRIERRDEEILFYLPLVIEQMVLGVGSSLDIGPCMKWIVEMSDERDSHNAVTELLRVAQQYMKSGVAIDESLCEVARLSGHTELKHVFISLSQVVKHGGEVTKQLQELANAVATLREVKIEGQIKTLEVKATAPVALVFASFMGLFLTSLGIHMFSAFK